MSSPVFTAEDIRQFYYCKRIIFFRYVLRARVPETYKMQVGRRKHSSEKIDSLLKQFSSRGTRVEKNVYLESEAFGLKAIVDALIIDSGQADIVEVKSGEIGGRKMLDSHKAQLAAQAILVEEKLGLGIRNIVVLNADTGEVKNVKLVEYHRRMVFDALSEMRKIVEEEDLPEPTNNGGKCVDCEYKPFCTDVI